MNILLWMLIVFATYRLAELISIDDITKPIRSWLGRRASDIEGLNWRGWKFIADLVNCPYCTGIWIAFVAAFFMQPTSIWLFIVYWLSIAGGQTALETFTGREK